MLAVPTVRAVRFGRPVKGLAVRKDVGFGQLMEAIDKELKSWTTKTRRKMAVT